MPSSLNLFYLEPGTSYPARMIFLKLRENTPRGRVVSNNLRATRPGIAKLLKAVKEYERPGSYISDNVAI
jgi:hypothetical protein